MREILKVILVIVFIQFLNNKAQGQQTPHHTQYMYNTQLFNPAYVGSIDHLTFTLSSRLQWLGLNGAPETHTASSHKKLKKWPVGVGVSFLLERIGPVEQKDIIINTSYTIIPTEKTKLAFGLKLGGEITSINLSRGVIQDANDPLITPVESKFTPALGAGVYWYSTNWYLGFSTLNLLPTKHFSDGEITRPHYYLLGGYVFEINRKIKFKPAVLTKIVGGAPTSINASANFLFNESFTLGLAYNNGQSLSMLVGAELNSVLSIGYSFDYSLKSLNQFNSGSHELVLTYRFVKSSKAARCPARFF